MRNFNVRPFGLLLVTTLLVIAGPVRSAGADPSTANPEMKAVEEARMLNQAANQEHKFICTVTEVGGRKVLRYVGPSDEPLQNCLGKYVTTDIDTLRITSSGGEVKASIASANIVYLKKMNLEVVGGCTSSCAMFIVPAAQLVSVAPYSLITLHTSPAVAPPTSKHDFRQFLISQGITDPAEQDRQIANNDFQQSLLSDAWNNYEGSYKTAQYWEKTDPTAFTPVPGSTQNERLRVADKAMYEICTGHKAGNFWEPKNDADWQTLMQYYGKYVTLMRRIPNPSYTCQ
jgi:hypothetical protein